MRKSILISLLIVASSASVAAPQKQAAPDSANMQQVVSSLQQKINKVQASVGPQIQAQTKQTHKAMTQLQKQVQQHLTKLQNEIQQVQANLSTQIKRLQKEVSQIAMMK